MPDQNEQSRLRRAKLQSLRDAGHDPFLLTRFDRTHTAAEVVSDFERLEGQTVSVSGRLTALRSQGKVVFADLRDASGRLQLFVRINLLGEERFAAFKDLDLGDILGARGEVFRTRTGEVSVAVSEFHLLAKALRPLPDKHHGLRDVEQRYRRRYVDLIANEDVRATFHARSLAVRAIRRCLDERDFLEVETPMLHPIAGGATARPFVTHHNALDIDFYLRIAPELYLKRLIVGGFERVYEVNRNFRNEGVSTRHNPEFTMLEAYQAYADYGDIMELTEAIICAACEAVHGALTFEHQGADIDLTPPWPRRRLYDALQEETGVDFGDIADDAEARDCGRDLGLNVAPFWSIAHVVDETLKKRLAPTLVQPVFLIDYPVELSPLAKRTAGDARFTERFQPFIGGLEIGNAFSELNDPNEQRQRFADQVRRREAGDDEAHQMDEDYVRALEYGMPPTGGLGIGIDRLTMLLTDNDSIRDVILFPAMRPETQAQ